MKKIVEADLGEHVQVSHAELNRIGSAESKDDRRFSNCYDKYDYDDLVEKNPEFNPDQDVQRNLWEDFEPTWYQFEWFQHFTQRDENGRFLPELDGTAVVHRRAGKSVGILKTTLLPWIMAEPGHYVHVFPSLTQGRTAIWNGIGRTSRDPNAKGHSYLDLFPKELWRKKNNHAMSLTFHNGSIYQIVGARGSDGTADHLRGLNPMGVIADEFGDWNEDVIDSIFGPIIGQNGGFIFKIGTPKGENHFHSAYLFSKEESKTSKKDKAWLLTVDDTYYNDGTRVISQEYIDKQLRKGADPETIQQEYYCSFKASASGAWFKHTIKIVDDEGRITHVPKDPMLPVYGFYDLAQGGDDFYTCVYAQFPKDGRVNVIDYIEARHISSGEFIDMALNKHQIKTHFFPWDSGHQQDFITASTSRINLLKRDKGIHAIKVDRGKSVADDVEIAMRLMAHCWFNEVTCKKFINHIRNYKKKKNQTTGVYTNTEAKDQHTHAAAAYRTLALAWNKKIIPVAGSFGLPQMIKNLPKSTGFKFKL